MKSYACYPRTRYQPSFGRFVNPYFTPAFSQRNVSATADTPAANILRTEGGYVIEMAIPGLDKENIRIEMDQDRLIVQALETNSETTPKFVRHEFNYQGFKRTFRLHKNANTEAMTATFNQGILTLVIPDKEPVTQKIEIK